MYIKIYFDNKPLFLCDAIEPVIEEYLHHDDAIFIDELDSHTVKSMIHEMQLEKVHAGVFLHPDFEELKKFFFKKFTLVIASGGLVQNEKNEYMIIFRKGKWDLPKGKLDAGEKLEECAVREIEEETGLKGVQIESPLIITYHTYHENGNHILKETHWFLMLAPKQANFVPQQEEGIDKCEWVPVDKLAPYMENTHGSIIDVVNTGVKQLHETRNI